MISFYLVVSYLWEVVFVGIYFLMIIEELDCEKWGYKLIKIVLGIGVYVKVKLVYVMESKVEKDKRFLDDLVEKGYNMVSNLFMFMIWGLFFEGFSNFIGWKVNCEKYDMFILGSWFFNRFLRFK